MNEQRPLVVGMPINSFFPSLGGAQVGLHNIATRLQERNIRPVLMVPAGSWIRLRLRRWRFPYAIVPLPPMLTRILPRVPGLAFGIMDRYWRFLQRRFGIDVWHCTFGYPLGVSLAHYQCRAENHSAPCVVRCVGDDIQVAPAIGYGMRLNLSVDDQVRKWLPRVDGLVAITESVVDEYRALGVSEDRIVRIPNGVDVRRFADARVDRSEVRRQYGIHDDSFVFLTLGRYHRKKNFEGLVAAFAKVAAVEPSALLVVAGQGVSVLEDVVGVLGFAERIRLVPDLGAGEAGSVPSLPSQKALELYRCADAFVLPSFIETFGIALVEAMAAGLPVITTDVPGCRDVVRHGKDGMCVAPDPDSLAAAMLKVVSNKNFRGHLAENAIARSADFSWDGVVDAYVELYHALGATGPAPISSNHGSGRNSGI
jgi:glycosyltransferase involved in cell wall biosynthesis